MGGRGGGDWGGVGGHDGDGGFVGGGSGRGRWEGKGGKQIMAIPIQMAWC